MFKSAPIHAVVANVELSEEEKAAINQMKIADYILVNVPCFLPIDLKTVGSERPYSVNALLWQHKHGPLTLKYPDAFKAQQGMAELKEQLTNLKGMLDHVDAPKHDSFEL
jgi:hypothetical protein